MIIHMCLQSCKKSCLCVHSSVSKCILAWLYFCVSMCQREASLLICACMCHSILMYVFYVNSYSMHICIPVCLCLLKHVSFHVSLYVHMCLSLHNLMHMSLKISIFIWSISFKHFFNFILYNYFYSRLFSIILSLAYSIVLIFPVQIPWPLFVIQIYLGLSCLYPLQPLFSICLLSFKFLFIGNHLLHQINLIFSHFHVYLVIYSLTNNHTISHFSPLYFLLQSPYL